MKKTILVWFATFAACQPAMVDNQSVQATSHTRALALLRAAEPSQQELRDTVEKSVLTRMAPGDSLVVNQAAYLHVEKRGENLQSDGAIEPGHHASVDYTFLYAVTHETESTSFSGTLSAAYVFDGNKFVREELATKETAYGVTDVMNGRVSICETGAALYKATIHIAFRDGHEKRLFTAQDGTYEIRAVKGEEITVSAWSQGYVLESVDTFVPDEVNFKLCPPLPPLPNTFTVLGTVHDLDGEIVDGAWVSVAAPDLSTIDSTLTSVLGAYELAGLPETAWSVTATQGGKSVEALLSFTAPVIQVDLVIPNHRPVCDVGLSTLSPVYGQTVTVSVSASDAESDAISLNFLATAGSIAGETATRVWTVPSSSGPQSITVSAGDGMAQGTCSASLTVSAPQLPDPEPPRTIVPIAGGGGHTCAVTADAKVRCWGRNLEGQLGNGAYVSSATPVTVSNLTDVVALTAGAYHSCARSAAGAAYCWGRNSWGQLGDNSYTTRTTPVAVSSLGNDVLQIEAGFNFTCAVLAPAGNVKCWGLNNHGQVGYGTHNPASGPATPQSVILADGTALMGVERIEAGGFQVCALKQGALYCWGETALGDSPLGFEAGPDRCDSPSYVFADYCAKRAYPSEATAGVVDFVTAQYSTCVLFQSGALKCWGDNRGYQLGADTQTDTCAMPVGDPAPCSYHGVDVESDSNGVYLGLKSFSSGSSIYGICGNDAVGDVICWGSINLSTWSTGINNTPHATSLAGSIPKLKGLASGAYHVCGTATDGKVYCWGNNGEGQLGMGTNAVVSTPVRVLGF